MSATTSATTGRRYGLERVCRLWERSRSALYARRARLQRPARGAGLGRRGPTPALSDAQLLAAIRSDLARSPFRGEGHRKVHARLRILDGVWVSRTRVLRVMRAKGLLSPHRGRQADSRAHDGTIVTSAPDVMWGTDGVRVFTADDGWVWTFAAVDHWNAECVGWHVCKVGSRFAALEPVAQGLRRLYGSVEADVARGLALRMDHGSQYLSDHFLNQLRYWGIHPSFGFLEELETNGVVERWNRTLKEQAVYGRVFRNLADVRAAVARFVERYNQCWRLEKLAYRTPLEAREEHELRDARLGLGFGGGRLCVGHGALPGCRNTRSRGGVGGHRRRVLLVAVVRVPGWRDREVNGVEVFGELGRDADPEGRPLVERAGLRAVLVEKFGHAPLGGALVGEPGFIAFQPGARSVDQVGYG